MDNDQMKTPTKGCRKKRITKSLTKRQLRVYCYIESCLETARYSPTLQEIADRFGFTCSTAQYFVNEMVKKGWLVRQKYSQLGLGAK